MHGSNSAARLLDEEYAPTRSRGYPNHYQHPSLGGKIAELRRAFPTLDTRPVHDYLRSGLPELLPGAEERFVIIRRSFFGDDPDAPMRKVAQVLKYSGHSLYNWGFEEFEELKPQHEMLDVLEQIGREQDGDILIVDGQFGLLHAGEHVYEVRNHCIGSDTEFPVGAPELGCMLLTAPMRLSSPTDLLPVATGESYTPKRSDGIHVPYFGFGRGHHTNIGNWNFLGKPIGNLDPDADFGPVTLFARKNK